MVDFNTIKTYLIHCLNSNNKGINIFGEKDSAERFEQLKNNVWSKQPHFEAVFSYSVEKSHLFYLYINGKIRVINMEEVYTINEKLNRKLRSR